MTPEDKKKVIKLINDIEPPNVTNAENPSDCWNGGVIMRDRIIKAIQELQ